MINITASHHGLSKGDVISMPVRLSKWQRFLLWIFNPFEWPPKIADREFTITSVANFNSFEIKQGSENENLK